MGEPMRDERGFALIVSLLALVLLTFLGLTMALSTSTELQIATNYRWSQQALYNAEAGIEIAKRYLRQVDWVSTILPAARPVGSSGPPTPPFPPRTGPDGEANRSFENQTCDAEGQQGFGLVLDDPTYAFPYQNMTNFLLDASGQQMGVAGAFTVWVRRALLADDTGAYNDNPDNTVLVLTAEGVAPYTGASGTSDFGQTNRAVRLLEVVLQKVEPGDCENRSGQQGGGPSGSGYDRCDTVKDDRHPGRRDGDQPGPVGPRATVLTGARFMATTFATETWVAGLRTAASSPWFRHGLRAVTLGLLLLVAGDRSALMATSCGIDPLEILKSQVKHNVLILFDTSGSMNWPPTIPPGRFRQSYGADDPETRMWQAKQATRDVVQDYTGRINFGILTFPNSNALKPLNANIDFNGVNTPSGGGGPGRWALHLRLQRPGRPALRLGPRRRQRGEPVRDAGGGEREHRRHPDLHAGLDRGHDRPRDLHPVRTAPPPSAEESAPPPPRSTTPPPTRPASASSRWAT